MNAISSMVWVLNILEMLACITGFIFINKLKNSYWRWLPFYLLFIILIEFTGRYFADTKQYANNINLYKFIGFPVQFLFFYFILYAHSYFKKKKTLVMAGAGIYIAAIVFETIFISDKNHWFYSFSYSVGNIILLILLVIYFTMLVKSDDILKFKTDLMFWFCAGLLVYYLGSLPYWGLRNVLVQKYLPAFIKYSYIWLVLDYIMYILFSIGIIFCKQK